MKSGDSAFMFAAIFAAQIIPFWVNVILAILLMAVAIICWFTEDK